MGTPRLHFYFLNRHDRNDQALSLEADIVKGEIIIKSVEDMVSRVIREVASTGGKIFHINLSSHGGKDWFFIGLDGISMATIKSHQLTLGKLIPHFHPEGSVKISACLTGNDRPLLYMMSLYLGGVPVEGWTGSISPWRKGPFEGMRHDGNKIVCNLNGCGDFTRPWVPTYTGVM